MLVDGVRIVPLPVEQAGSETGFFFAPPLMSVPAIAMNNLVKRFGTHQAVGPLSLCVEQGEIFGLLGPNGSGKTTTINMISGLSTPTSGDVRVLGFDVSRQTQQMRQVLGVVPQETALYEELTAWDNMDFHATLYGVPRDEKRTRITRMLELVQLQDRKNSRVGTFSGGMKRRLALGRALLHAPELLYLDEPTLGVDVQSRQAIWDHILTLRTEGKTVLITTNYLEEAQSLCDRLAIIDHGKLIALDTPKHLIQRYGGVVITITLCPHATPLDLSALYELAGVTHVQSTPTFHASDTMTVTVATQGTENVLAPVVNLLSPLGVIIDITRQEASLNEVFLRLTGKEVRDEGTRTLSLAHAG